jgi:hypothetical protein
MAIPDTADSEKSSSSSGDSKSFKYEWPYWTGAIGFVVVGSAAASVLYFGLLKKRHPPTPSYDPVTPQPICQAPESGQFQVFNPSIELGAEDSL